MSHDGFSLYKGVKHVCYTQTPTLNYTLNQFIQFFIHTTFLQDVINRERKGIHVYIDNPIQGISKLLYSLVVSICSLIVTDVEPWSDVES